MEKEKLLLQQEQPLLNNQEQAVFTALKNPKYEWRTVRGIAKETSLDVAKVMEVLTALKDGYLVVKSSVPSKEGLELITSREKFRAAANVGIKILGSLRNRST